MSKVYELKVFKNGGSNAVRIPAAIQIPGDHLYLVLADDGSMTIDRESPRPMSKFFAMLDQAAAAGALESIDPAEFERKPEVAPNRAALEELEAAFKNNGAAQ